MKRIVVTVLAVVMMIISLPEVLLAEEITGNSEVVEIQYDCSENVTAGTIRYISQVVTGTHFQTEYWPETTFGKYTGASRECKTSCISMALSYLGIDRTPADMLKANDGVTKVNGWGANYTDVDVNLGMDNYLTGKGMYSPVLIHLPKYSLNGHYILLVGQLSKNVYQALDPWECAVTSVEINGKNVTYTKSGKVIYDTIDQSGQWYLDEMSVAEVSDSKEEVSVKENEVPQIGLSEEVIVPKALGKLKATALTATKVKLSWSKQSNVTGYKVYQKVDGKKYKLITTVSNNTCKVKVDAGKKYNFKVVPYIQYENEIVNGKAGKCDF